MASLELISGENLKAFARCIASSVFVVTTFDKNGKPHGATISAGTSLSLTPPMVLICLAHTSSTLAALRESSRFRLHVLAFDQSEVSQNFASKYPSKCDTFLSGRDRNGVPVLDGVVAAAECRAVSEFSAGDHAIIVGALDGVSVDGGLPLIYHHGTYAALAGRAVSAAA